MSDPYDPVTRLGPAGFDDSPRPTDPNARVYRWEWGPDDARRPGLPWIGIFLLVFGSLLLIQNIFPEAKALGSVVVLAIGLTFLVRWAITRGSGSLYAGAIITALAVPGLLNAAGIEADGLSQFSFGIAFLFIALVRAVSGGGWGWQLWFGGMLTLLGAVNIANPTAGDLLIPSVLIVLGVMILIGAFARRGDRDYR
jgi:hypothetical protein